MSLSGIGSDPRRWREWATKARATAEQIKDETSRRSLNLIADIYDKAADRDENAERASEKDEAGTKAR